MAGAERVAVASRGGCRCIKAQGCQGQGKSQESLEMPDTAHPAIDLTGHLPAAKASEVIESGRGWKGRGRGGGKFAARQGLMEGSVHLSGGQGMRPGPWAQL